MAAKKTTDKAPGASPGARRDSDASARPPIEGIALKEDMTLDELLRSMRSCGLQASQLAKADEIIAEAQGAKAKIILTFTTNLVSSGMREVFARLCREKKVNAIITAIGSIEEDVMKTRVPFRLATFEEDDRALHKAGLNRVGNIIIPNEAYVELEKMLKPFFLRCLQKQEKLKRLLAPHEMIRDLGLELDDEESFVYWAAKNNIPIFCPAPTDGAFGLQMYFFKQAYPGFGVDASGDLPKLGQIVLDAEKTAGIILGGGVAKHHAIGANILREGFDYAVYVSTGTPYDGSLSGARTSEAVSWGKIKEGAKTVHVDADATLVFPMLAYRMLKHGSA
ncbi:MAG: deoxyhypusine synthase [Candidatus Micrarchaeota archaeon]